MEAGSVGFAQRQPGIGHGEVVGGSFRFGEPVRSHGLKEPDGFGRPVVLGEGLGVIDPECGKIRA